MPLPCLRLQLPLSFRIIRWWHSGKPMGILIVQIYLAWWRIIVRYWEIEVLFLRTIKTNWNEDRKPWIGNHRAFTRMRRSRKGYQTNGTGKCIENWRTIVCCRSKKKNRQRSPQTIGHDFEDRYDQREPTMHLISTQKKAKYLPRSKKTDYFQLKKKNYLTTFVSVHLVASTIFQDIFEKNFEFEKAMHYAIARAMWRRVQSLLLIKP